MNEIEAKALSRLQKAHDDLKKCRFRETFSNEDLPEYIAQLYELSDAWSNYCYRVERPEPERTMVRKFCSWIHDYNSVVLHIRFRSDVNIARYWIPYFEAMLTITHIFLDTGDMSVFYNPYVYADSKREKGNAIGERWCLVTSDACGIESAELPRYFPVTLPLCTDSEKMKKYFLERRSYGLRYVGVEQRTQDYLNWEQNMKPILIWVNENLVSKTSKEDGVVSSLYYAAPV